MSLWRKRISIKSDDLSIKSEKAMREVQRLGQEIEQEPVACAKICDAFQERDVGMQPAECAGAIRARGQV
jgi:hypothetical protein